MFRALITIVLLNLSSAILHNTMFVVGDEEVEVGTIPKGGYRKLKTFKQDSCRIIFTLGEKCENWLGTGAKSVKDTIIINDKTEIFEYEL